MDPGAGTQQQLAFAGPPGSGQDPGYWAALERMRLQLGRCPHCDQRIHLYPRQVNHKMAVALTRLCRVELDDRQFIHVPRLFGNNKALLADFAKMKVWGFIDQEPNPRADGSYRSGWWRPTQAGRDVAEFRADFPKYAFIYNDKLYGMGHRRILLRECFNEGFDYQALMRGAPVDDHQEPRA